MYKLSVDLIRCEYCYKCEQFPNFRSGCHGGIYFINRNNSKFKEHLALALKVVRDCPSGAVTLTPPE